MPEETVRLYDSRKPKKTEDYTPIKVEDMQFMIKEANTQYGKLKIVLYSENFLPSEAGSLIHMQQQAGSLASVSFKSIDPLVNGDKEEKSE